MPRLAANQRKITLTVTLSAAQLDMEPLEIAQYVEDAVSAWGGGGNPESAMFDGLHVDAIEFQGQRFEFANPPT